MGVTLHTGSRNPGNVIGKHWMDRAKKDGTNFNGLYMYPIDSDLGMAYFADMSWAFHYADMNRSIIMKNTLKLLGLDLKDYVRDMINETHNHAIINDDGTVLHRKGATPAEKGVLGIIPGNMRDGVYVTSGLGNEEFLSSASHGAGRRMSRTKAKAAIDLGGLRQEMAGLGILVEIKDGCQDEGPDAYKDIKEVIALQNGLVVNVIDHFSPKIVLID